MTVRRVLCRREQQNGVRSSDQSISFRLIFLVALRVGILVWTGGGAVPPVLAQLKSDPQLYELNVSKGLFRFNQAVYTYAPAVAAARGTRWPSE
jgi:hypothetical protein